MVENRRFEIPLAGSTLISKKAASIGCGLIGCLTGATLGSAFGLVLHAVTRALQDDRLGVMEQTVQDGGGNGAVVVEDAGPLFEWFISGQHDGATFVTLTDDLEEEVGTALVDGKIAKLIQCQKLWPEVFLKFAFERAFLLSRAEVIDDVDSGGKENRVTFQAGGVTQGGGEMRFARHAGSGMTGIMPGTGLCGAV